MEWGCSKCKGDEFEEGDQYRSIRNCDSSQNKNISWPWMPSLKRCPWSQIDDESWFYIQAWVEFERFRVLPFEGADFLGQPNLVVEGFLLIYEIKAKIEKKELDKQKKEHDSQIRKTRKKA